MTTQTFLRRYLPWRRARLPRVKPWDRWAVAVWGGIALVLFVLAIAAPFVRGW